MLSLENLEVCVFQNPAFHLRNGTESGIINILDQL